MVGEHLLAGLRELQRERGGLMSNARGRGLMIAFDLPAADQRNKAKDAIWRAGLLVLPCGDRSVRFRPPLNLTKAEVDEGLSIIDKTLGQVL